MPTVDPKAALLTYLLQEYRYGIPCLLMVFLDIDSRLFSTPGKAAFCDVFRRGYLMVA